MYYIKNTSGTVWNLVIIWGRRCYASSACISYMQTLIHKECNYYIYLHTSSACEGADSFFKCFLPSVKWLDCTSDTAMLSKWSNCCYYIICVWILEKLFRTNYVLMPNWQLWGLKSAVHIHEVGPVAECALSARPSLHLGVVHSHHSWQLWGVYFRLSWSCNLQLRPWLVQIACAAAKVFD